MDIFSPFKFYKQARYVHLPKSNYLCTAFLTLNHLLISLVHRFANILFSTETDISMAESTSPNQITDESIDEMPDSITHTPEGSTVGTCSYDDQESLLQQVEKGVEQAWRKRDNTSRYQHVIVLLVHWKEHDLGDSIDNCVSKYEWMFHFLYNYEVWRVKLPSKKPHEAFARDLLELAGKDSPDSLFIIWYDGHGIEHGDRRGSPTWSSHQDPT